MHITAVDVIAVRVNHRGDWLHVRLTTDAGLIGFGEASHGGATPGRDAIVAAIITHACRPLLLGKDPRSVRATIAPLVALMDGLAGCTAVSGCEQALWDLAGKAAGVPVYRLLGGPARDRIPLYANINRAVRTRTPEAFAAAAVEAAHEGFRAIKCAPFDGMEQRRVQHRDQRARIRHGVQCLRAMRDAVGAEVELYVDCHSRFDVPTAVTLAGELRALGITWFEEPVPTEDLAALTRLRTLVGDMETVGGETLAGVGGFLRYLTAGVWDCIMPDVKHCGGIGPLLAIAEAADAYGVTVAPHNPSGPVALAATAQVAATLPTLRAFEYAWGEVAWRPDLVSPRERIEDGAYVLPDTPGIGVALDAAVVAAHAVEPGTSGTR